MNDRIAHYAAANEAGATRFHDLILSPYADSSPFESYSSGETRARRIRWTAPVDLGSAVGTVRDISASGIYFETDARFPLLSPVLRLEIELDAPNGKVALTCLGEVVRVEPRNKRVGVAVRLIEAVAEPIWLA